MHCDARGGVSTVFPLPLTAFEHYMLADDRAGYPMNIFMGLRFDGRFDRSALDAALARALPRHPLLSAVAGRSGRRWVWKQTDVTAAVHWLTTAPAETLPNLDPIDIRVGPASRVVAAESASRTDVVVQVHHAASDGLGVFRFIEDWLLCYAHLTGAVPDDMLPRLSSEQLRHRGWLGRSVRQWPRALLHQVAAIPDLYRFARSVPESLARQAPADGASLPANYPAILRGRLDETQTAGLFAAARQLGVTVNDWLTRQFLWGLAQRLSVRALDPRRTWVRVAIPFSLRTAALDRLSAANAVSFAFLNRRLRDLGDHSALLQSVHDEMQCVKRFDKGLTFVLSVGFLRRWPGLLEWILRRPRCTATGVFTNLGRLLAHCPLADEQGKVVIGDVTLDAIDVVSPWRPLTPVGLAAWTYAGRLSFTLHCDGRVLPPEEARAFLDDFLAGLCDRS